MTRRAIVAAIVGGALASGVAWVPAAVAQEQLRVTVESNARTRYVSGGDVLVRVTRPVGVRAENVRVSVAGRDVSHVFSEQPDGSLLGLVTGLREGRSTIVAQTGRAPGSTLPRPAPPRARAAVRVINHPITGPVFSGPQQTPFFCETEAFGLAPARPPNCSAPTVVSYQYRTTAGQFAALADPSQRPADVATASVDGRAVPYIVRLERGTINRAVYEIATLYDGTEPSPVDSEAAWNERLVYTFGGGCNVGYHQGASTGGVLRHTMLSRGFAVASSSLNVLDNNCNHVISAETALMVKEHFIETYGPVRYTIGWGGSGGAIQQHLIADNYPGILDGITPSLTYPDALTVNPPVSDCRLLVRYFQSTGATWTDAQKTAVSGFGTFANCVSWDRTFASRINALEACPAAVPVAARYHPETNPGGIRCTSFEQNANILGRDPATGFVLRPLDNVGVQYGLEALRAGVITLEQFLDLNDAVGGYDVVGNVRRARTEADPLALERAYRSGLVTHGGGGLASTPIIDHRPYTDLIGDIHTRSWSFTVRERLQRANGSAANQVILVYPASATPPTATPPVYEAVVLDAMDRWLAAIAADTAPGSARAKIVRNRPADLSDGCWTAEGTRIVERATWRGPGVCNTLYPSFATTRIAAGGPLTEDVLKCRLRPVDPGDYPGTLTAEQRARLEGIFPNGVCDFSRGGVGQQPVASLWLDFARGPIDQRRNARR